MKKTKYIILLSVLISLGLVLLTNYKIVKSQDLEPMPDNVTLSIGQTYSNMDRGVFFIFCGVEGNFFGAGPMAITVGHITTVINSDLFGSDQVCMLLFQEGDSIFFREFEYVVTTLQQTFVFIELQ